MPYPQEQLEKLKPTDIKPTVQNLMELRNLGKPQTDQEVRERIDDYFQFCQEKGFRPAIESLCLALHISRMTLWKWEHQQGCSAERAETVRDAKAFIAAFLETTFVNGRINPVSGIFLLKNWLGYKDTIEIDAGERISEQARATPEQIAAKYADVVKPQLPEMDE